MVQEFGYDKFREHEELYRENAELNFAFGCDDEILFNKFLNKVKNMPDKNFTQ